ncbi:Rhomboid protease GluP [uncultured bacterium]|nr:Rhomboid protease GluP [uncultured bacterium]
MSEGNQGYFKKHQEQAFLLKAFGLILVIIALGSYIRAYMGILFLLFPVVFLIYVRLQAISSNQSAFEILKQHITFMPFMYADGDRKKEGVAWVTYSLVAANVFIFYVFQQSPQIDPEVFEHLLFLPMEPNAWNVPLSAITSVFLHADNYHLWGNMVFLWVLGTVVEKRIGWVNFLLTYLAAGVLSGLISAAMGYLFLNELTHGLGASGAISGVMGIFAVRCYFKSMVFPLPILGVFSLILPISLKIRLNSLVIIGLFFIMDLSGGIGQISGTDFSNIGHWAHIGGMLSGIVFAAFMGLGSAAVEERHLEIGIKASDEGLSSGEGEESLRLALQKNPSNPEALLHLARMKSRHTTTDEGKDLYQKAMRLMVTAQPQKAASVFKEFHGKYLAGMEDLALMHRIAGILYKSGDFESALNALEAIVRSAKAPKELLERATFQFAAMLDEIGNEQAACMYYEGFLEKFPESQAAPKVRARLSKANA